MLTLGIILVQFGWREWDADHRLPFTYNVTSGAIYAYAAALKRFAPQIKIVHFLGKRKPWLVHYESGSKGLNFLSNYHQEWHDVYSHMLQEHLPDHPKVSQACNQRDSHSMSDVLTYSSCPFVISLGNLGLMVGHNYFFKGSITSARKEMSQLEAWEAGNPDYLGDDSFEKIQKAMESSLLEH
ncbi:hypothetical protein Mgra_00008633 [Meloidogyne graminicola]|uniref:Uncharacterized protein n=1 Tax=Meloidogyne graminicola TaxID=189291 RepID=A0A8S9ZF64_9BILA|nr:hypothetical protein Mgra_00008633 [Meloidogyne graminicola]